MPSIYQLKPRFQNLLRPGVQRLYDRGVTANQVTLAAAVVSVLLGALLAIFPNITWLFALIPLWMLLRMALNAVDGMLAREFGQQSKLGAYLNELSDVVADTSGLSARQASPSEAREVRGRRSARTRQPRCRGHAMPRSGPDGSGPVASRRAHAARALGDARRADPGPGPALLA